MSALTDFLDEQNDLDLQIARRAFPVAQREWEAEARSTFSSAASAGWHGSAAHKETGAVGVVPLDGEFSDLVGEIVRLRRAVRLPSRLPGGLYPSEDLFPAEDLYPEAPHSLLPPYSVIVYVVDRLDVPVDISVSRRAFQQLGLLTNESVKVSVEILS